MKKNSRLILMIISMILIAQLIFAYTKASGERGKSGATQSPARSEIRNQ